MIDLVAMGERRILFLGPLRSSSSKHNAYNHTPPSSAVLFARMEVMLHCFLVNFDVVDNEPNVVRLI